MEKFTFLLLISTALFIASCNKDTDDPKPLFNLDQADPIDPEDYQIYSTVLDSMFSYHSLIVNQQTTPLLEDNTENPQYQYLMELYIDFDSTLIRSYLFNNDTTYTFNNNFTCLKNRVQLITSSEISYYFSDRDINNGWKRFYSDYPNSGGIVYFSRIGYNTDKTQALLEIDDIYCSLGAEGYLIYMTKDGNQWKIKNILLMWIS